MITKDEIQPHLLVSDLSDEQFVKLISEVSEAFTTKREAIGGYTLSKEMISAYTLVYLPTHLPKFDFLLNECEQEVKEAILNGPLIDVGTGPGTFLLAAIRAGYRGEELYGLERSALMREQASKILSTFAPEQKVVLAPSPEAFPRGAVLLFGHSLNEMEAEEAIKLCYRLKPKIVLFIEPGTKEAFIKMRAVQSALLHEGFFIHYPCPTSDACHLAADNWCHQIIKTTHDPSIERITQLAKLDRRSMPSLIHVFSKTAPQKSHSHFPFRYMGEVKHAFLFEFCDGSRLVKGEVLKRSCSKSFQKEIAKSSVGRRYEITSVKEVHHELIRIELNDE